MKNVFLALFSLFISVGCSQEITITNNNSSPQVEFAINEIKQILKKKETSSSSFRGTTIEFKLTTDCCKPQGYSIENKNSEKITVKAVDNIGLMYGGLEIAEQLKIGINLKEIKSTENEPYVDKRGIKFNIPLDIRTSSFDDSGSAAQENIAEMWDFEFWKSFFDSMAKNRYNAITFWNAHPFSSMVKLDDYPDVALNDIYGTTIDPIENQGAWNVPELANIIPNQNIKVLKKMTIDEKIAFWQRVMEYGKNRGIDIYFITWNICLNGAALPGSNKDVGDKKGKYGITNDFENEISKDYLRKSVKQFLLTYPNVKGIGVTAGENMRKPMDADDQEKWLWETYGLGIADAKKLQPERQVNFIHRVWWTNMEKVDKYWNTYPDPFELSFKYAKGHMYSAPNPSFSDELEAFMVKKNMKAWWNLRNDDIYIHRWGDPEYVSEFIKNLPKGLTAGYHMGSDGYVWGREFISKDPELSGELEIDKHWYKFMLWGRLGYNPEIKTERFQKILKTKFPETNAKILQETWATASKIIPEINKFHWRDWDYMWQPEACMETWNSLRSVDSFITTETMKGSNILNVKDYVSYVLKDSTVAGLKTPLEVADHLDLFAKKANTGANTLTNDENSKELQHTLLDIKAMAALGQYYSYKIKAAVALEFYKNLGKKKYKSDAVSEIKKATKSWEIYSDINAPRYKKQNFARLRNFDFKEQLKEVILEEELMSKTKTYAQESVLKK